MDELRHIDSHPLGLGHVHLIERKHDREAKLEDLAGEEEIPLEVGRIEHDERHIRLPPVRVALQQHFQRHLLIRRAGRERVAPR